MKFRRTIRSGRQTDTGNVLSAFACGFDTLHKSIFESPLLE